MTVEDVPLVFRLGERLYTSKRLPVLYRTWDPYEVASLFATEIDLTLIATEGARLVGFSLATVVEKPRGPWRYGYLIWLGVDPAVQSQGIGQRLVNATARKMRAAGVHFLMLDTEEGNVRAIQLFRKLGFRAGQKQVWLWKDLRRPKRSTGI